MTQLFDTQTYEDRDEPTGPSNPGTPFDRAPFDGARHLRSMPAGDDLSLRSTQWRLDQDTIERGRKGIQAARQALQEAARVDATAKPARKAA